MGIWRSAGRRAAGTIDVGGQPAAAETLTVGDKTYTYRAAAATNLEITIGGSTAATATNTAAAINANPPSVGVEAKIDTTRNTLIRIWGDRIGTAGNITISKTVADAAFVVTSSVGGENRNPQTIDVGEYTVLAIDQTAGNVEIPLGVVTPRLLWCELWSSAGLFREDLTDQVTVTAASGTVPAFLRLDGTGATNPVAGDVVRYGVRE